MFLEIHIDRRPKTPYVYGLFRQTYRQDGKVKHKTRGRVTGLSHEQLLAMRDFMRRGCPGLPLKDCRVKQTREWGAGDAALRVAEQLGLPRLLYSRRQPWVRRALAMIVGRIVYQGSKLSLTDLWKDTALWSLCGLGDDRPDVDACYAALDRLLERQPAIQKALARQHLQHGCLVLYDVTSSYPSASLRTGFEGAYAHSQLVTFAYNRDGKRGHKQVVIALMTDAQGCPVGVHVYRGNTSDQKTLGDRVRELKKTYGLREVILAGDRGMLTSARLAELSEAGLRSVTALTHPQIFKLIRNKVIDPGLFDEREIAEVHDADDPAVRYLLYRNPLTAEKESCTRAALIGKTREALERLARSRRTRTPQELAAAVGKALAQWKVGKFFQWTIHEGRLEWSLDEAKVQQEASLDGCYVVRTDVPARLWDKSDAVSSYRQLAVVEQGFRQLKTVALEIPPAYHHPDRRIEAHVFLCMLAYYIQWHMRRRLRPLFESDGQGKDRGWTFAGVLERLKAIRQQTVVIQNTEVTLTSTPDPEQARILDLLGLHP